MDSDNSVVSMPARFFSSMMENEDESMGWQSKFGHLYHAVNVIQSRNMYWKGHLMEVQEKKRRANVTETYLEVTQTVKDYFTKMDDLWSAIEGRMLRAVSIKTAFYNATGYQMMARQTFSNRNSDIISFGDSQITKHLYTTPSKMVDQSEILIGLCKKQEHLTASSIDAKRQAVFLNSEARQWINQNENPPEESIRHQERKIKTKIGRCVINALLSGSNIDFEANPELLALKLEFRQDMS